MLISLRRFLYGFEALSLSLKEWIALVSHVIPRDIEDECRATGLLDFKGALKYVEFWEAVGDERCKVVTNKDGKSFLFRSFDEALDFVYQNPGQWRTKKLVVQPRRPLTEDL